MGERDEFWVNTSCPGASGNNFLSNEKRADFQSGFSELLLNHESDLSFCVRSNKPIHQVFRKLCRARRLACLAGTGRMPIPLEKSDTRGYSWRYLVVSLVPFRFVCCWSRFKLPLDLTTEYDDPPGRRGGHWRSRDLRSLVPGRPGSGRPRCGSSRVSQGFAAGNGVAVVLALPP